MIEEAQPAHVAVVQQFYDQWNAGAIDFDGLVHTDVTNHRPDRHLETGLERFRRAIEGVTSAVPDSTWTTIRLVAQGDFVVCHNRWSGTYGGAIFRGIPTPSGERVSCSCLRLGDTSIFEPIISSPRVCGARLQAKDVAIPTRELPDRRLVVDPSPDEVERLAEVIAAWVVEVGAERPAESESWLSPASAKPPDAGGQS